MNKNLFPLPLGSSRLLFISILHKRLTLVLRLAINHCDGTAVSSVGVLIIFLCAKLEQMRHTQKSSPLNSFSIIGANKQIINLTRQTKHFRERFSRWERQENVRRDLKNITAQCFSFMIFSRFPFSGLALGRMNLTLRLLHVLFYSSMLWYMTRNAPSEDNLEEGK